MTEMVTEF